MRSWITYMATCVDLIKSLLGLMDRNSASCLSDSDLHAAGSPSPPALSVPASPPPSTPLSAAPPVPLRPGIAALSDSMLPVIALSDEEASPLARALLSADDTSVKARAPAIAAPI